MLASGHATAHAASVDTTGRTGHDQKRLEKLRRSGSCRGMRAKCSHAVGARTAKCRSACLTAQCRQPKRRTVFHAHATGVSTCWLYRASAARQSTGCLQTCAPAPHTQVRAFPRQPPRGIVSLLPSHLLREHSVRVRLYVHLQASVSHCLLYRQPVDVMPGFKASDSVESAGSFWIAQGGALQLQQRKTTDGRTMHLLCHTQTAPRRWHPWPV